MANRVIIIIPAYNESKSIQKVLKDIEQNASYADVVVVNDCSTDNTEGLVKKSGAKCITNVFNMRYAWAVQTGLKYASQNQYDYAILMDADGQHLASEAIKLYEEAIKSPKTDIVIGSRYIKKTGYHCPFFRKIGTKVFKILIKIFTGKTIADPLSGLQCLDKRVIDFYAECGNYPEFPDASLIIEMLLRGYTIKETPVKMLGRENGTSMHSGIWKPIKYMTTQFYTCIVSVVKYIGRRKISNE